MEKENYIDITSTHDTGVLVPMDLQPFGGKDVSNYGEEGKETLKKMFSYLLDAVYPTENYHKLDLTLNIEVDASNPDVCKIVYEIQRDNLKIVR